MGILRGLFEQRGAFTTDQELPGDHWFFRWFGGGGRSDAGVYVNEHVAMNTLLVASCVRILSETLASLPLPVYERIKPRGRQRARGHSLYTVLNDEVNAHMAPFTYFERLMAHLALWGNHYSTIERDLRGNVVGLWPVHPRLVEPYQTKTGEVRYRVQLTQPRDYPASEILHIPGLALDGLKGLSPLSMMRQAVGITVAAESYGAKFFGNDARPDILLKHPAQLTDVARENLVSSWKERHGDGKRGIAVLEEGMDISVVGMPPGDAQFLETRKFQVQELARFFRIPPHLLADVERSTSWGSGIEHQSLGFVVYTMRPWLVRIEQEMKRKLIPRHQWSRFYVEFLVDGMLRGDVQSRTQAYATARQWGWMSANDIRELENQNPIEGGDVYLQPMNMIDASRQGVDEPLPERAGGPLETRAMREERSATARRRLANAHRAIYRDVATRLIRIERNEVRGAVRRQLRERSVEAFEQWVREFYYEKFPGRIVEYMGPPVRTLMDAIAAEVVDEVGGEAIPAEELDVFAREYTEVYALRHAGDSRSRLLKLINEHEDRSVRQADDLADLIDEDLDTWDERVDRIAEDEAHRSANAAARWGYVLLGILTLRWIATGSDPCDYCQGMDGRTVSSNSAFLAAGTSFAPGGIAPFLSRTSVGHPPLHDGCQCVIAPG